MLLAALSLTAAGRSVVAEQVIFTIDANQSSISWSGFFSGLGSYVGQYPGSLSAPVHGHFLVDFDPTSGIPSTLEFVGGHGYYEAESPHIGLPGPAPANALGQSSSGALVWAIRDLVWDFSSAPISGSSGVFQANQTSYTVLSGRVESNLAGVDDWTGSSSSMTSGTWTISESSPGSGAWTLVNDAYKTIGDPTNSLTATSHVVAMAQYSAANIDNVADGAVSAEALGGATTTGGVSASFSTSAGEGMFSAQRVDDTSGLSLEAVQAAGELNPFYGVSTAALDANPQIWDVDFDGDLNGGTVDLVFAYDESLLPAGLDESQLGIWHFDTIAGEWVFGGIVDTEANTVTYTTSSFSPFQLGVVPEPSSLVLAGIGGLALLVVGALRFRQGLAPRVVASLFLSRMISFLTPPR